MNQLKIFKNNIFEVAVKLQSGEWVFDAEKVAKSLGITQQKSGIDYVRWERVNEYLKASPQVGKGDFIPEPAVYKLAFKASNEVAEKFQDWLAVDVLPQIRKHGIYATDEVINNILSNPDFGIKLLTELKQEKEEKEALLFANKQKEQLIGELKPKADYMDKILKNTGLVTITQIAKDYGMSGEKMNSILHNLGVQYKQSSQWLLYTPYQDKGYTHSETVNITRHDGRPDIKMNTKWTQKGRLFLYELLKHNEILPAIERKEEKAS